MRENLQRRIMLTPKLVTVLREGYRLGHLRADSMAGLTVAIVAMPLSMAIAIASHAAPEAGLFTAIVGGFLISALGGSRYQIGGPAGAFIVLVASIIESHGMDGLLLATMMAGVVMLAAGLLRLGGLVRLVPHPVVVGFSAGIAVIIAASQIKDLLGVRLAGPEPGELLPKLAALAAAGNTASPMTIAVGFTCIVLIVALRLRKPHWPGFIVAVALAAIAVGLSRLNVETIGSRFGGIPHGLPLPRFPVVSRDKVLDLLPAAISLALLGSIESLLSAVVADNMKGRRHRSNAELVAQGVANVVTPLFGGITVTGTIARTATNVRAGAHSPVAGMIHSAIILLVTLVAAPLAAYVPLTALAAILLVVSWNMFERAEFARLLTQWTTALPLLATFLITIFRDLLTGIACGTALAYGLSFFARSSDMGEP